MSFWAAAETYPLFNTPKFTEVGVVANPALVRIEPQLSEMVLVFTPLFTPDMIKVSVGSTVTWTWTESIVAILAELLSSVMLLALVVLTAMIQLSEVPATFFLVGLMSVGVLLPMVIVMVVPAATILAAVHVIVGELTTNVLPEHVAPETVTLPVTKPLNAKADAEGDAVLLAAPGKVTTIVPLAGILVTVLKVMVCCAAAAGWEVVMVSLRFPSEAALAGGGNIIVIKVIIVINSIFRNFIYPVWKKQEEDVKNVDDGGMGEGRGRSFREVCQTRLVSALPSGYLPCRQVVSLIGTGCQSFNS